MLLSVLLRNFLVNVLLDVQTITNASKACFFPDSRISKNGMEQTEHQAEETGEDLTEDHSDEKQDALTHNEHFKKMNDGWIMKACLPFPDSRTSKNGMEKTDHQAYVTGEDLTEDPSDEEQNELTQNELFEEMNDGWKIILDRDFYKMTPKIK